VALGNAHGVAGHGVPVAEHVVHVYRELVGQQRAAVAADADAAAAGEERRRSVGGGLGGALLVLRRRLQLRERRRRVHHQQRRRRKRQVAQCGRGAHAGKGYAAGGRPGRGQRARCGRHSDIFGAPSVSFDRVCSPPTRWAGTGAVRLPNEEHCHHVPVQGLWLASCVLMQDTKRGTRGRVVAASEMCTRKVMVLDAQWRVLLRVSTVLPLGAYERHDAPGARKDR
jgi:hypothetical protein